MQYFVAKVLNYYENLHFYDVYVTIELLLAARMYIWRHEMHLTKKEWLYEE